MDEAALRRATGGPEVMAGALRHLIGLIRGNRVIVQVLPFGAGAHPGMQGCVRVMDFADAPPLAYLEGVDTGQLEDGPATVARYRLYFELLTASALSPEKSPALLDAMAQDYDHEEHA